MMQEYNGNRKHELIEHCKMNILQAKGILPTLEGIDTDSEVVRKVRKELELQEIALAALTAPPIKAPEFAVHANQPCWPSIAVGMRDNEWNQALRSQGYEVQE